MVVWCNGRIFVEACRSGSRAVRSNPATSSTTHLSFSLQKLHLHNKTSRYFSTTRLSSSTTSSLAPPSSLSSPLSTPLSGSYLPPPPSAPLPPPEATDSLVEQLTALGEPTLSSLGLASWYPHGLVQSGLENLHVGLDVPWWTAIAIGTLIVRLSTFPLVVLSQRNAANMHNHMPIVQKLQAKFQKVKNTGNTLDAALHGSNLYKYMQTHKISPLKNMMVPLLQLPIFVSVFMGLRQMANLPVESMVTAGLLWFTDLTCPDPYYILPVLTMATFATTIELGVDGVRAKSMTWNMRMFMRGFPLFMLPFTINFPSALLVYWFSSNTMSLIQVLLMRIPRFKEALKIPPMVLHAKEETVPVLEKLKSTWQSSTTVVNVEEMQKREAVTFKEAGLGAIKKTYSYDPTTKLKG